MITLGIIGVVAALTIPTLIQNYKKKIIETRLVKFYSTINQAINFADIDNGGRGSWTDDTYVWAPADGPANDVSGDTIVWFNTYLKPYLKVNCSPELVSMPVAKIDDYAQVRFVVCTFDNGEKFAIRSDTNREWFYIYGDFDKCAQDEDGLGKCAFPFLIPMNNVTAENPSWKYHLGKSFEPYLYSWDGENDTLYEECSSKGLFCGAIIQRNGWKVPDNYPRKF